MTASTQNYKKVSIVIAVKELNDNLRECLKYCLELDYPEFEILVFPDATFGYSHPKVKVVATGRVTPPVKRDLALPEAKGEILAFLDDDAYPEKGWLKNAVVHFEDEDVAAVCGPAVTPASDPLPTKASGGVYESPLVSGNYVYRYLPKERRKVDDYPSCNFLVRKEVFQRLGGFHSNYWPGEDTVLCLEITKKLNQIIVYDPRVLVFHHRRSLFRGHLRQIASYALHRGYFVRKFPQTSRRLTYFVPSLWLLFLACGLPLAVFHSWIRGIYFAVIFLYLLLVFIFSIRKEVSWLKLFGGIISTHLVYGAFFLKGLFSARMKEEQ